MREDEYFHVPLDIDIQSVSDDEINNCLQNMSRVEGNSPLLRKSINFFVEYYNKSIFKLRNMTYDELFIPGLIKDNNGNDISPKELEMGYSLNKLKIEFDRYLLKHLNMDSKQLLDDSTYKDRFNELFKLFFTDKCKKIIGDQFNLDDLLDNLANYLHRYVSVRDNKDDLDNLYRSIASVDAMVLAKYNRLLNLEAKLAHTSRMVFMTIYHTKDMKDNKLRELAVLSVMFHDIGRFYQALYYPSFHDVLVKNGELNGDYNSLLKSHAEVGYYFPMQNLIVQDLIRCNGSVDEDFVMHTLMSVVIKYHGRSNSEISHYDVEYGDVSLSEEVIEKLEDLIIQVFKKSPRIPVHARFDTLSNINHMKEFHTDIANYIISCILLISDIKKKSYHLDDTIKSKVDTVEKYLLKYYSKDLLDDLYEHPEKLEESSVLEKLFGINPPEDFKITYNKHVSIDTRLDNLINNILTVDYATTLNDVLSGNNHGININPELLVILNKVLGALMTITTDMDKIDILNQRINGSWEKTNNSRFDRKVKDEEFSLEEAVDNVSRDTFFSDVGMEPYPDDSRSRGAKILQGTRKSGNAITALWFHLDQFITVNLRNFSSFELLDSGNYLEKIRVHMIEEQDEPIREQITPLINEPIAFVEMFINFVLNVRVDKNGKYIYPTFDDNSGEYIAVENLEKPVLFNANDMAIMRGFVLYNFKKFYNYVGSKPVNVEYPIPKSGRDEYKFGV